MYNFPLQTPAITYSKLYLLIIWINCTVLSFHYKPSVVGTFTGCILDSPRSWFALGIYPLQKKNPCKSNRHITCSCRFVHNCSKRVKILFKVWIRTSIHSGSSNMANYNKNITINFYFCVSRARKSKGYTTWNFTAGRDSDITHGERGKKRAQKME